MFLTFSFGAELQFVDRYSHCVLAIIGRYM